MTAPEKMGASLVGRHLEEAQSRAESGNYAGAITAVREAKALEPRNVYILAFEKQAEQLNDLKNSASLTDEQRTDILESMPSIIEKAVEISRTSAGVTNVSGLGKHATGATREVEEKAAAHEWLKNQYFQHAHDYVRKGEYQHALAEIRRVYIIDPENRIAKDFEKQIDQLARLRTPHVTKLPAETTPHDSAPPAPPPPPVTRGTTKPRDVEPAELEPMPMMTEEWSSPQQHLPRRPKPPVAPARKPKKKGNSVIIVLIILALIALGVVLFWYYQRNVLRKNPAERKPLPPAATELFLGAPAQTAEQSFLVSQGGDDSSSGVPDVTPVDSSGKATAESSAVRPDRTVNPMSTGPPAGASRRNDDGQSGTSPASSIRNTSGPPLQASTTAPAALLESETNPGRNEPRRFVAVEKEARIIKLERPKLTALAFQLGVQGEIVIRVEIDSTGKPLQTITLTCTNDLLIDPVREAVMSSQYLPAEMTSGPVRSWLTIPFRFADRKE